MRVREECGSGKEEKSQGTGQATACRQQDGWASHFCSTSSSLSWWQQRPVAYTTGRRGTPFPLTGDGRASGSCDRPLPVPRFSL